MNLGEAVGRIGAYGLFDIAFENGPNGATCAAVHAVVQFKVADGELGMSKLWV